MSKTPLKWDSWAGSINATSGNFTAGYVVEKGDGGYTWGINVRPERGRTRGDRVTRAGAQKAVQGAWDRWCVEAGLVAAP